MVDLACSDPFVAWLGKTCLHGPSEAEHARFDVCRLNLEGVGFLYMANRIRQAYRERERHFQ